MKFIHLTDPHLTASGDLFEIDVAGRLADAVASINAHHGDATLAVITGDISHWGEPGAYEAARTALDRLAMPWYPLMGNHDVRDAFHAGLPDAPRADDGRAFYRVETEAGPFLMLDTLTDGTHAGLLDDVQLGWLDAELDAAESDAYLFMHHPPLACGLNGLDNIRLINPDDLHDVLMRHPGTVRHLFFGHMHRTFHGSWRGLPFSTVKATAHQVSPEFGPEVPLRSSSEVPAYAVVLIDADAVAIHDISYLEEDLAFDYDREFGRPDRPDT